MIAAIVVSFKEAIEKLQLLPSSGYQAINTKPILPHLLDLVFPEQQRTASDRAGFSGTVKLKVLSDFSVASVIPDLPILHQVFAEKGFDNERA